LNYGRPNIVFHNYLELKNKMEERANRASNGGMKRKYWAVETWLAYSSCILQKMYVPGSGGTSKLR